MDVIVRSTLPEDFGGIIDMCNAVYPGASPWQEVQLASHLKVFPEGQLVAFDRLSKRVVGMAASLIVLWDDYESYESWRSFTDRGMFTNHDPENGRTLYGAEIMVHPDTQGQGVGSMIYAARRELCERLNLRRIRAGARLRGYSRYAERMTAREYADSVVRGELRDPTLSFQLRHGFRVLDVVQGYLKEDPESLGFAAVIEWPNPLAVETRVRPPTSR
ncbi:MAG: GNAT family N-acetyltransferase [Planctomycetes bacterium]|nr:GNAT family N-acetyltransferase [Planctomycetota bacterium]